VDNVDNVDKSISKIEKVVKNKGETGNKNIHIFIGDFPDKMWILWTSY